MKVADLRALASWMDQEAADADRMAGQLDRMQLSSSVVRVRAEYCASTAIHLRELADAFQTLSQLSIQP